VCDPPQPLTVFNRSHDAWGDARGDDAEIDLTTVRVSRYVPLSVRGWEVVAGLPDGTPLIASRPQGKGRVLLSGLAPLPTWSTWPLKPAFVATFQSLALGSAPAAPRAVAGRPLPIAVSPGEHCEAYSEQGISIHWIATGGDISLPVSGVYRVRAGDEELRLAVSADALEGDMRTCDPGRIPALEGLAYRAERITDARALSARLARDRAGRRLRGPLLVLALLAMVVEAWLVNPAGRRKLT
jgi:hypothetical protein